MKGSIRAITGLLIVFCASGGLDNATDSQLPMVLGIAVAGLLVMASGVSASGVSTVTSATYYLINFDSRYSASMAANQIFQVTIPNALDKVKDLRGVSFSWKENGRKSIGLIAQEVEKIIPELVNETDGVKSLAYGNIVGLLIEAIKEQQNQIDELKRRL